MKKKTGRLWVPTDRKPQFTTCHPYNTPLTHIHIYLGSYYFQMSSTPMFDLFKFLKSKNAFNTRYVSPIVLSVLLKHMSYRYDMIGTFFRFWTAAPREQRSYSFAEVFKYIIIIWYTYLHVSILHTIWFTAHAWTIFQTLL